MTNHKKNTKAAERPNILRRLALPAMCVLAAAVAFALLLCGDGSYLYKLDQMSIFVPDAAFAGECLGRPAGLLRYLSMFMTQWFAMPWLGALLFTAGLALTWWLTVKAAGWNRLLAGAAIVPAAMMLWAAIYPGYAVMWVKSTGWAWYGPLGLSVAAALAWAWRASSATWLRALIVGLTATLGWWLFGVWALAALVVMAVMTLRKQPRQVWLPAAGIVLAALTVFVLWPWLMPSRQMVAERLLLAGLPDFYGSEAYLLVPYWIAMAALAVMSVFTGLKAAVRTGLAASLAVWALSLGAVWLLRYDDANFFTALRMERDIDAGQPDKALAAARAQKEMPTRLVGMLTHLALVQKGVAGDSLFAYPAGDAEYRTERPGLAMRSIVSQIYNFNMGRLNDAYRWCMEDMVENGHRVQYLRYMAKCALLNGEYTLARKYARRLGKTMMHGAEGRRLEAMADDTTLIARDPELGRIIPLACGENFLASDQAMLESYINTTGSVMGTGPAQIDLSLQYILIQKTIDRFWPRFIPYAMNNPRLPRHYQEAAILFSVLEQQVDWRKFNIDPAVADRFFRFMEKAKNNAQFTDEYNREAFGPEFGDTYWYYYFFVKNLKTN